MCVCGGGGGGRLISDWALVTEAYNRAGREFGWGGGGGADNWKGYRWAGGGDFQLNEDVSNLTQFVKYVNFKNICS